MLQAKNKVGHICFGIFLVFVTFSNLIAQIPNKAEFDKEVNLNFDGTNIFQACAALASFEKIPLGIELSSDFDFNRVKKIQIRSGTLRAILNSIIEQDSDYKWEFRDGVVNVFPIRSRDKLIKSVLETKIRNFSSKKEFGRQGIASFINGIDEIQELLNSKNNSMGIFTVAQSYSKDKTSDIELSGTDLRGILNKVVHDSGDSKMWSIQRSSNDRILLIF